MIITPELGKLPLAIERSHAKEMLSLTQVGEQTQVRINFSSLDMIQNCPRKAQLSLLEGWKSKADSPATIFGGAIHKALECFYLAPRSEREIPKGFAEESDLMAHGHPAPNDMLLFRCISAFTEHASALRGLADTDKRSLSSGVWLLQNYFKTYIADPWEVLYDEKGEPLVERRAEVLLEETPSLKITGFGTIDVVLRNAQTGGVLAADHKTSSIIGNDFYNRLKPNAQYGFYYYLAKEVLGLPVSGFLINCLEVKSRPLTARGGPPKLLRQVTTRTPEDTAEMIRTFTEATKRFLSWKEADSFPLGPVNSCASYGGCQYLEVCSSPENIRPTILENKFTKVGT